MIGAGETFLTTPLAKPSLPPPSSIPSPSFLGDGMTAGPPQWAFKTSTVVEKGIFKRFFSAMWKPLAKRAAGAAVASAADGPLPVGDILGVALLVWGIREAIYCGINFFEDDLHYEAPGQKPFTKFELPTNQVDYLVLPGGNRDSYLFPGNSEEAVKLSDSENLEPRLAPGTQGGSKMKKDFRKMFGENPPIGEEELMRLTDEQLALLRRNHEQGLVLNRSFGRSPYYPFPRDLSFPPEKPLFVKWSAGKRSLVEIGVFEGASAHLFRSVMANDGTLHLIDPFVVIPDSSLTARPWMAKLNVLRSRNGSVEWHKDYSDNVARNWREPVDFLFIDGDHAEAACRSDWEHWSPFVVVGGVVVFHDARFGKGSGKDWDGWPGPSNVVDSLFRGPNKLNNWEIVEETGSAVVVKRIR